VEAIDIWFQYRFGSIDPQIRALFIADEECVYLVCKPDIPWEADPLRETPHLRPQIFDSFISLLNQFGKKYYIVEGEHEEDRWRCTLNHLNKILIEFFYTFIFFVILHSLIWGATILVR
jgi:nicotinamide riboside kinase